MNTTLEILDVKEKDLSNIGPPSFPTAPTSTASGFPAHKKRISAFKEKQRQAKSTAASSASPSAEREAKPSGQNAASSGKGAEADERRGIDEENRALLGSMSPEDIAEAQRDLYSSFDPKFIQMLLRRANLDEPTGPSPFDTAPVEHSPSADGPSPANTSRKATVEDAPEVSEEPEKNPAPEIKQNKPKKTVTFDEPEKGPAPKLKGNNSTKTVPFDEDAPPPVPPPDLFPASNPPRAKDDSSSDANPAPPPKTHFPRPPSVPDLDPADPDFLETMHQKFFPDLPADPSKLAWMAPVPTPGSTADRESPYYPGQDSLPVSALRFDFRGRLLPPRASRAVPVTKGLHHHGEAPEAAGYTVPELARLARSAVPGQRCIAYQTLGRMLYRLGRGEWGVGAGGQGWGGGRSCVCAVEVHAGGEGAGELGGGGGLARGKGAFERQGLCYRGVVVV
ncbi:hypothetical protein VTK56DRAFT_1467 [Thermocarpiscus australiensis]